MLPEADMSMTQQAMGQLEDPCYAEFYIHPRQNQQKTLAEGRPIYDDVPYVMIMVPGDKDNVVRRPVRGSDKMRWPRQWQAFEQNREQPLDGTPLALWPQVTAGQVKELQHFGVRTVEQLAAIPDSQAQKFMGINKLKQAAKDYIAAAKSDAPMQALREKNEKLEGEIDVLKAQMKDILAEKAANAKKG